MMKEVRKNKVNVKKYFCQLSFSLREFLHLFTTMLSRVLATFISLWNSNCCNTFLTAIKYNNVSCNLFNHLNWLRFMV